MKVSRDWLQTFFDHVLPSSEQLSDALTFHAFEIESVENDVLDVKVTPNRGHDCLSVRGIAKELSAILDVPMKADPLRAHPDLSPTTSAVQISIDEPVLCRRYIAGYIRGVQVKESPDWLKKALESMGQRSINNVVDATNYVMFHLGQPLHAFDAGRLTERDGVYAIRVRKAHSGERMVALDEKEYTLSDSMLVIADARADAAIGIAGVKGGAPAGITEETSDIIIESANFDGVSVRKTAQTLKLRTDASSRFEQGISSELAAYGMRAAADLIAELAGGELVGFADEYPTPQNKETAQVSLDQIHRVLGISCTAEEVVRVFTRLGLAHEQSGDVFEVHVPFERLDLSLPEDLIEEVGRIIGYDRIPAVHMPRLPHKPEINIDFARSEAIRSFLVSHGFSEVFTSVFTTTGDRVVLNKVDGVKPYLRSNIVGALEDALERNIKNKDLLGLKQVKMFEIGKVWVGGTERNRVAISVERLKGFEDAIGYSRQLVESLGLNPDDVLPSLGQGKHSIELDLDKMLSESSPIEYQTFSFTDLERYQTFSKYPFIVRDIALWVPESTSAETVLSIIRDSAGDLLIRSSLFDEFKKDGRVSYAFRLVFQSFDKTLTDSEVNERMDSVNTAVRAQGWEVR